jgi:hypothetical protein
MFPPEYNRQENAMNHHRPQCGPLESFGLRRLLLAAGSGIVAVCCTPLLASEPCGTGSYPFPYTDVASVTDPFCPGIMEAYVTGVSKGTTPTTFSPNATVTRVQMTTFLQRSLDQGLERASRRAALGQWWTPQNTNAMQTIDLKGPLAFCAADGKSIWVPWSAASSPVYKVQASTGVVTGPWTGATNSEAVAVVAGKIYLTGFNSPGDLYVIDSTQPPGAITVASASLGDRPIGLAFDGTNLWSANEGPPGSVSIITPQATTPYPVTTVTAGFNEPFGILYDGANIWVTDYVAGTLLKLDPTGVVLQTVSVGGKPTTPAYDGTNIWVPNLNDNSITVVQASTGNVVATITADASNLLHSPTAASFDGQRIMVTNQDGDTVTLFKAADLSFIANIPTGASSIPRGACSDGINFWVALLNGGALLRF